MRRTGDYERPASFFNDEEQRIRRALNESKKRELEEKYGEHFSEPNPELSPDMESQWLNNIEELKKMEALINEINLAKKEQAEKNLDTRTFSIYWLLKGYCRYGADDLAKTVDDLLRKYPNWALNSTERRDLKLGMYVQLLKLIAKERVQEVIEKILDVVKR